MYCSVCGCGGGGGGYSPHRDSSYYFFKALDELLGDYDNILLLGDFNSTQKEQCMKDFCETIKIGRCNTYS